jgi:NADH-quinone oxidoreductase subunit E
MTDDQRRFLARLQGDFNLSKTEILLKGLALMGEYYSLGLDNRSIREELQALEQEAVRYSKGVKRVKQREEAYRQMVLELREIDVMVDRHGCERSALIQILLEIQKKYRWLPKHAMWWVSERLDVPMARILHIATFYSVFSLSPKGKHIVRVCLGTACHVRGGPEILWAAERALGVKMGGTTPDMQFTLEGVNCLGCCALGPVMVVDDHYHGKVAPSTVAGILDNYAGGELDETGISGRSGEALEEHIV